MKIVLRSLTLVLFSFLAVSSTFAQGFSFSCTRDTSINLCNTSQCITIKTLVPDIHAKTNTYTLVNLNSPGNCFRVTAHPNELGGVSASLTIDDRYSDVIPVNFNFPFYDSTYRHLVASTNGYVSFDTFRKKADSHFEILNSNGNLSANNGIPEDLPSTLYDRALIMGPYHDINPAINASPNRVRYLTVGTAPHRKWILNFYKVPLFNCNTLIENTHQITLYESTGIIEVAVFDKQICTGWNQGRAMIGLQSYRRDQGMMVPNRAASSPPWGSIGMNEGYRFIPASGAPLIKRVELYDMSGTLISTGTTTPAGAGSLAASFPQVCPPLGLTQYIVRSVYTKIDDPTAEVFGSDTINVTRTNSTVLNATSASTPSACGPNGTVTVTLPSGMGTAPFNYAIDGGASQSSNNSTYTFTGLIAGNHTVVISDASGCSTSLTVNVSSNGVLNVTSTPTPTSCNGASNGSITVNPQNGTTPFQYSLNGGAFQSGNVFSNLAAGTYFISVKDASGCQLNNQQVTIAQGSPLAISIASAAPACAGASNGSLTVTPSNGTAPYNYSLNGNPFQTNNVFSNLPTGTYFISAQDALGCYVNNVIANIGASTGSLNATATGTGTSCSGINNGSITITPSNGSAPYQYSLDGGATYITGLSITGLAPGNYSVTVKDAAGCTTSPISVTVTAGNALLATTATSPTSCTGVSNGSITVTPSNGSSPYTYQLDAGSPQSSATFNGVAAGSHTIIVTDGSGCISNPISVTVAVGPAITGTANATATSCSGATDGIITVSPSNGSGPYTYSLDNGVFQGSNTFNALASGNHTVIIKDASGCTSNPISVTVAAGAVLTGTATSSPTSCTGVNNGSITATPTNGTGPFTYSLDNGAFQSSNTFAGVSAGSHNVVIRNPAGCVTASIPVTVAIGPAITGMAATTATSCNGATNGSITLTPTNGSGPYTYQLDGGAFQSSNNFTGLAAGAHTVIIKDAVGCASNAINVTVAAGAALAGTATATAPSCLGATNGSITATPTNGNGPYTYSLDNGAFQSSNTFTNIPSGNHTILIRDVAGCTTPAGIPVTVPAGSPLTATVAMTPTSCSGAQNGTLTVTTTSGTGPFQYSIDGTNFQSANAFTGLATGSYTITYKNGLGCQATVQATVNPGQPLSATVAANAVKCNGASNGSATITISTNGAPPYQYSLNGTTFQPSNIFSGLAAGNYTVYFKDQNNCAGTQTFTIAEPAVLTIAPAEQAALCNGQTNGRILIGATGGTAPYQYSIDGTTFQASNSFNVAAGSYTVYVKDNNNCQQSQSVVITQPVTLSATAVTANATCDGGANGTITLTPNGGTTAYQYAIDGGSFQSSNIFNVRPGSYAVVTKDANGCVVTTNAVVGLTNNLTLTPARDTTICEGLGVQLQAQTNATQFAWSPSNSVPGNSIAGGNTAQPTFTPSVTTAYNLIATLGVCTAYDTVVVNVRPAPVANAGPDGDICYGQTYQLQGSGGIAYSWSPSTYLNSAVSYDPVVTPAVTTQYSLSVTDANGCRSLQPDVVTVKVTPPIVVRISRDTAVANGDVFQLQASSVATDYLWSPAFGLDDPTKPNPKATITGDITYTVIATTSAGCKGEASVTIKVYEGPEIYVPTAFTPNGDGKNDVFTPFPVGIKQYTYFRVFNRWGQLVFSTTEFNKGWDGTISGKMQPVGTYVWMVEGITKDNKKITKRGTVTIIR